MRIHPHPLSPTQTTFEFDSVTAAPAVKPRPAPPPEPEGDPDILANVRIPASVMTWSCRPKPGADDQLEALARQWLIDIGFTTEPLQKLHVIWNTRLKSTAGYASYPSWRIELNPRLVDFAGQVERTLRHELAHLVAFARAGKRKIEPHGPEWRQACADLGIADEPAHHRLPLPRTRRERGLAYQCPHCAAIVHRVQPFKRPTACLICCRQHNRGQYHDRFRFARLQTASAVQSPA